MYNFLFKKQACLKYFFYIFINIKFLIIDKRVKTKSKTILEIIFNHTKLIRFELKFYFFKKKLK